MEWSEDRNREEQDSVHCLALFTNWDIKQKGDIRQCRSVCINYLFIERFLVYSCSPSKEY